MKTTSQSCLQQWITCWTAWPVVTCPPLSCGSSTVSRSLCNKNSQTSWTRLWRSSSAPPPCLQVSYSSVSKNCFLCSPVESWVWLKPKVMELSAVLLHIVREFDQFSGKVKEIGHLMAVYQNVLSSLFHMIMSLDSGFKLFLSALPPLHSKPKGWTIRTFLIW